MDTVNRKNTVLKKIKSSDLIGAGCGVLVVLMLVLDGLIGAAGQRGGVADKDIPPEAVISTGTAQGRNGPITVQIAATSDSIYQVKVIDQAETDGIGSEAVENLPSAIYEAQSLKVDAVSGATISSDGIKAAIVNALQNADIEPGNFGGATVKAEQIAKKVETGSGVTVITAADWAEKYPEIYASYMKNGENSEATDYLEDYPMLPVLYDNYGFAKFYSSARGHIYDVEDVESTGRPHALANCYTCKTPNFTAMVNELGDAAYAMKFEDVMQQVNEPISCYNCHANTPGKITVTHSYLINAVGEDFDSIDAANLACGQCHVEYYFDPATKATTLPYGGLAGMNPDEILAYYDQLTVDGESYADYTNPRTGVRQIKVQHPELETFLGEGSEHRDNYTCADCHMGEATTENGTAYVNHELTSPLDNQALIENECSKCHVNLAEEVKTVQKQVEGRTYSIGYELEFLTERLAAAVESGDYSEQELEEIRTAARRAQFYWDFVFVENSEGAHNPTLTNECLDKAQEFTNQALGMFKR